MSFLSPLLLLAHFAFPFDIPLPFPFIPLLFIITTKLTCPLVFDLSENEIMGGGSHPQWRPAGACVTPRCGLTSKTRVALVERAQRRVTPPALFEQLARGSPPASIWRGASTSARRRRRADTTPKDVVPPSPPPPVEPPARISEVLDSPPPPVSWDDGTPRPSFTDDPSLAKHLGTLVKSTPRRHCPVAPFDEEAPSPPDSDDDEVAHILFAASA